MVTLFSSIFVSLQVQLCYYSLIHSIVIVKISNIYVYHSAPAMQMSFLSPFSRYLHLWHLIVLHTPLLSSPYIDLPTSVVLEYLTDLSIILLLSYGIVFLHIYVDCLIISLPLLNLHIIYLLLNCRPSLPKKTQYLPFSQLFSSVVCIIYFLSRN